MISFPLSLVLAAGIAQPAPQDAEGEKQRLTTAVSIRTPNGWGLHIHSDGSGGLQYGASLLDGWWIKAGTFDAKKVTEDLRALTSDEKGGTRSYFVFHFESERKGPEKGAPARYTRDIKVIPALFQKAIDESDTRFGDRKAELLKKYPPGLPKEK